MSKKKNITIIAAISENNVLGKNNKLIWHIPDDLKRFKKLTIGHSVIMGRKTFESMNKALPERKNIILTRNKNYKAKGILIAHNVQEALNYCENDNQPFIIGGGEIYNLFLNISSISVGTISDNKFEEGLYIVDVIPKGLKIHDDAIF